MCLEANHFEKAPGHALKMRQHGFMQDQQADEHQLLLEAFGVSLPAVEPASPDSGPATSKPTRHAQTEHLVLSITEPM